MFYNNKWGTICDNGWDINDAKVVCRQLGYNDASNATKRAFFGEGTTQKIWFQDLECRGNEGSLFQCDHKGVGKHNCDHTMDAGVVCFNNSQCGLCLFTCSTLSNC